MDLHNPDKSIAARFRYAIVLTVVTLVAEVAGGIWTNSLALLSDAAHVFLDLFALLLSLGAIKLAGLPSSEIRTFGWHRAEVFASFINGVSIFLIAFGILYEAAASPMTCRKALCTLRSSWECRWRAEAAIRFMARPITAMTNMGRLLTGSGCSRRPAAS